MQITFFVLTICKKIRNFLNKFLKIEFNKKKLSEKSKNDFFKENNTCYIYFFHK